MNSPENFKTNNLSVIQDFAEETKIKEHDFRNSSSTYLDSENKSWRNHSQVAKDAVFISLPPANLHENVSDNVIRVNELLDLSNGDSFTKITPNFNDTAVGLSPDKHCLASTSCQIMSSSIVLENKQSLHNISIPSNVEFFKQNILKDGSGRIQKYLSNTDSSTAVRRENKITEIKNSEMNFANNWQKRDSVLPETPSSNVVQSIFSDIFQDIEEIKDVISSYMSSFYVQEEEHDNYPALHKPSREVISYFVEQIHSSSKIKNCDTKTSASNFIHDLTPNRQNEFFSLEHPVREEIPSVGKIPDTDVGEEQYEHDLLKSTIKNGNNNDCTVKETQPSSQEFGASLSGYCFWEDKDLRCELSGNDSISTENYFNAVERTSSETNMAIIALEFIEKVWQEFTNNLEVHALFLDLVNENELRKYATNERLFPCYGHWASMYDQRIIEEAEHIVHSFDNFFMDGCFPMEEGNRTYMPCTIVELVDDYRQVIPEFEDITNTLDDEPVDTKTNIFTRQVMDQSQLHEVKTDFVTYEKKDNLTMNSSPDIIESQPVYHEIVIEHSLSHDVATKQTINCPWKSTNELPEYQNIILEPVIHHEIKSFSLLKFINNSTVDKTTAVENSLYDLNNPKKSNENFNEVIYENDSKYFSRMNVLSNKEYLPWIKSSDVETTNYDNYMDKEVFSRNDSSNQKDLIPKNIFENKLLSELDEATINSQPTMLKQVPESSSNAEESNPALMFSSPAIQLNLTNPLMNVNKK